MKKASKNRRRRITIAEHKRLLHELRILKNFDKKWDRWQRCQMGEWRDKAILFDEFRSFVSSNKFNGHLDAIIDLCSKLRKKESVRFHVEQLRKVFGAW